MLITLQGYSPEGFAITIAFDAENFKQALTFTSAAAQCGITLEPVDRKEELITTVVRREHVDDKGVVTPVVDFYPTWKGDYGQFRFLGVYLNTGEDIAAFESQSGLRLMDIPLYTSQVPLQRKMNRVNPCETKCRPFLARKRVTGEKEIDGVMQKVWKFSGYGVAASSAPAEPEPEPAPRPVLPAQGSMTRPALPPTPHAGDQGSPLRSRR